MLDLPAAKSSNLSAERKLTDVIHRLAAVGFSDIFNEEKSAAVTRPIVKIGEQQYRVLEVEDNASPRKDSSDQSIFSPNSIESKSIQPVREQASAQPRDTAPHDDAQASTPSQPLGVHPGIVIFLNPVNPKDFLAKLPTSLRSFIEETVKIVRQKALDGSSNYRFSFSELKLDILFENGANGMTIRILSEEATVKSSLLTKENQTILYNVLQQEFPNETIHVVFEETGQHTTFSQGGSGQNNQQHNQQQEDTDEE